MQKSLDFVQTVAREEISVPTWEILLLLLVVTICILIRGSRFSLLITYIFTLHIAWSFMRAQFGFVPLLIFGIFAAAVLLIGFYSMLTDRTG